MKKSHTSSKKARRRETDILLERLESRVLFDAVPEISLDAPVDTAGHDDFLFAVQTEKAVAPKQEATRRELAFVDTSVGNYQALIDDLLADDQPGRELEIVLLDAGRDGVEQITSALASRSGIDTLHVLSHGRDGAIQLGQTWLTLDSLGPHAGAIAGWATALNSDADLLIYGCNLAAGDAGANLLEALSQLTGADVAASDDLTGSASLGGDWDLEYSYGTIDSIEFELVLVSHWEGVLTAGEVNFENVTWTSGDLSGTVNNTETGNEDVNITVSGDTGQIISGPQVDVTNTGGFGVPDGTALYTLVDFSNPNQSLVYDIEFTHNGGVDGISFSIFDIDSVVGGFGDQLTVTASDDGGATYNLDPTTITSSAFNQVISSNTVDSLDQFNATGGDDTRGNVFFSFAQSGITDVRIVYKYPDAGSASNPNQQGMSLHDISFTYFEPPSVDLDGNDAPTTSNYLDDFTDGDYQDQPAGSLVWTGDWIEFADSGTAQSPTSGDIRIVNDGGSARLRLKDDDYGVRREADLSGFDSATLNFEYRRESLDSVNDYVAIEIATNGIDYTEIGRIDGAVGGTDASYQSFSVDISSYISPTTTIRFATSSSLGNNDIVYIDDVDIALTEATDTSFSNTFVENGPAVAISESAGLGTVITDTDSTQLSEAVIRILNPFAGDALSVSGALPGGISANISTTTLGDDTITLSGAATLADYETAIQQIRYGSSSATPDTTPRQVTVVVADETGRSSNTASATISVVPTNSDPNAANDSYATNEDMTLNVPAPGVLANDSDPETDPLTIDSYTQPTNGSVTLNGDGSFAYTPLANFNGIDTFTYTISDGNGGTNTGTVTITVNPVNDPPVAVDDAGSANEGASANIDLAANDSDADDGLDLTSIAIISGPANGSLTINGDGTVTYTHNGSETTSDSFTYTIDDASGETSNVATVNLTINPQNDPPVAVNDAGSANEGASANIDLAANDSDADDGLDLTSIAIISGPANGSLTINGDGTVTYTHDGSETTSDSFTYTIDDASGQTSNVATVNLTINPQNDPPVAVDDAGSVNEGATVNIDLATNDSDADDGLDLTSIAIIGGPANGSLTINGDGTVTYTHNGSETTTDSFTYTIDDASGQTSNVATVNLTINPQNDPPVAVDDTGSVNEGASANIDLAANDSDADDGLDLASIAIISGPANGSLTINGDGTVTYTHNGSETTTDSFNYTIDDASGQTSNVATVNLTINPQNDPPVAVDDTGSVNEGASANIDLAANDSDADDGLDLASIAIISGPANGSLTINGDGTVTYTHNGSETTTDSFTYTIDDASGATSNVATVNLTINPQNDPPVAVDDSGSVNEAASFNIDLAANDSDADDGLDLTSIAIISGPANGSLTINGDGTVTYTHNGSETTSDSFTYTIDDASGATSNVATVNLTINPQNDPPVAVDDAGAVNEAASVNIDLAANDSDADDGLDLTSIAVISGPANGSLTINGDGTVTYTHNGSETTTDSFTYTIDDASGQTSNVATVNLTINPQNDPPVAVDDAGAVNESASVNIDLAGNDSDADDGLDLASIAIIGGPANGSLTINGDGTVTYTHNGSETTTDSFTYTIDDASGQTSNLATVNLTINPQNDPPVAVDDAGAVNEGASVNIDLAANDSDADDGLDLTSITIIGGPANGSLTINGDGTVTYTHNGSETTSDSFTYTIDDASGQTSNLATVNLTINPQNDPPVAVDDAGSVNEGATVNIDLATNDSDADDGLDLTSIAIIGGPANGSLTINGDGTVTYTHNGSETTTDSFTYTIDDNTGQTSNVATVNLTINPQNDPPVAVDDSGSVNEAASVNIDLAANDSDTDDGLDLTSIAVIGGPANGSLTINGDGTVTYTHNGSETTSDSFTYTIDDASGETSNVATVNLTINPQNDPPVAVNDAGSANEGASANIDLAANDSDADDGLDLTSIAIISGPANGSLTINGDGTVTYTHDGSETTGDSFTYTIDDASGQTSNVATVNLTINPQNDPPVAVDDAGAVNEGASVNINLAANDSDADDGLDLTSIAIIGGPANGSLTINGDGTVTYTHNGSETTSDSFTYTIDDASGATSNVATVNLTINPQNDPPVAVDDAGSVNEGASVNIDLAGNDSDADDGLDLTSIAIIGGPANGSLTINGDGTVTYTHNGSETTSDSFTYTIDDASGQTSNVATVNLTINPQNDPPVAVDDAGSANEGASVNIDLAANDSDADDGLDLASIAIISGPANGSLTINGDGTVTYTHNGSETTTDSFTYTIDDASGQTSNLATVNLTINPQNDPPLAVDDAGAVNEGATVNIDLTANDSDADDGLDLTSIAIIGGPANGSLTINGDGTVTYTHNGSETTSDSFTYTIDDASGQTSNLATVNLTINPQNDPPVAVDDAGSVNEGASVNIDLAANDSDADDGLDLTSIAIISGPANGSLTINGDGTVTYTHNGSETTTDSFTYTIDDPSGATSNVATVNLTINPQNDPPVAVDDAGAVNEGASVNIDLAANDSDADDGLDLTSIAIIGGPANGSLTINGDGTVTYTHNGSETTTDSFTYTIDDASGATSNVATVNLTINPQNDPPVAVDDAGAVNEGASVNIDLAANDSDADDGLDLTSIAVISGPANGSLTINGDGTVTYTHNGSETTSDSFTYTIDDASGATSNVATVNLTINPQNDPPVAVDDAGAVNEGASVNIDLAANDSDADDGLDLTSIAIIGGPANGSLTINGDGTVTYTHNGSETTTDSFTYTIDDASGQTSNVATVNLTINPQNDPPVAVDDAGAVNEGASVNIDLAANDSDADDGLDLTSIAIIGGPANGSLTINGDGTVTYTHNGSETTSDSFTYTIDDNTGQTSNVATVNLTINPQNDPPVAVDDAGSVNEGASVNIDLAANDSDADDGLDLTSIAIISGPANGSLTINGDGTVTYTHDGSETTSDSFTYTIDDVGGQTSNVATVNLTINPQNDPPVAVNDAGSVNEGASVNIDLAANDSDADDGLDLTSIAIIGGPANGSLTINGDGTVTYTHNGSETTSDSFTYTIDDASGETSNVATVNLTINPQNDAPVAVNDAGSANEGASANIDLAANDSDADDGLDLASIAIISGPANGSLTINGDGTVTYTHNGSETTGDSFTYTIDDASGQTSNVATVNLTINPQNDPPVAVDDAGAVNEGASANIDLAANDSDADDGLDLTSIAIIGGPANGSLTINGDGTVTYTHDGSETTNDSFTYTIDDASGATSNVATVNLTINPQNDPPVAVDDAGAVNEGASVNIDLAANDSDADDGLDLTSIAIIGGPANGSLTINGDGTVTYTHNGSETTTDSFTYTIDDPSGATSNVATVNLTINPQNDAPVAVDDAGAVNEGASVNIDLAANDSDADDGLDLTSIAVIGGPANGSLTINGDGTVTYTHNGSETTSDSFTYTIDDASGQTSNVATVNLTINPQNDPPVAVDDSGAVNEGGSVNIDLASNDSDADDGLDLASIAIIGGPANGSLTINGDGTVTYTHNGSETTSDSFTYTIDDASGQTSNVATVNLTINPQNDPPVAVDDQFETQTGGAATGNLLQNDSDPEADPLLLVGLPVVGPAHGSVTLNPDGTFEYRPNTGYVGVDTFVYEINDGAGGTSRAAVQIDVAGSFAYDFFRNEAVSIDVGMQPVSQHTADLVSVDPIFTGFAEPGTTLVGKIYDSNGNLIGERTTSADGAGNWLMSFSNSVIHKQPHRMTVEQSGSLLAQGAAGGFNLRRYYHTASQPSLFFSKQVSVASTIASMPSAILHSLNKANEDPLMLGWAAHPYEMLASSPTASQM